MPATSHTRICSRISGSMSVSSRVARSWESWTWLNTTPCEDVDFKCLLLYCHAAPWSLVLFPQAFCLVVPARVNLLISSYHAPLRKWSERTKVVKIIVEPGMALKNAEHVMKMYDLELPFSSSLRHHVMPSPLCPASEWKRSKNPLEHQHLGHML